MILLKALKLRIYPNREQEVQINKTLGCCRFIYNQMLAERKSVYNELKDDKRKLYEYDYKSEKLYKVEYEFLKEADSRALQQSNKDLSNAYQNFFKSQAGKRKGEKMGFPKFKKKKTKCSYRTTNCNGFRDIQINFETKKIKLPKLTWINFREKKNSINGGLIKSATVSRSTTGNYYVSVLYEVNVEIPENNFQIPKIKGLDMSLQNFYVDELGNSPDYEQLYRKYESKLAHAQRKLRKMKIGSNNWKKQNLKVSKIHETIRNKREFFIHNLTSKLIKENDVIVIESLTLKGMSQCLNLGKSIMDLGYGEFIRQLQYKSLWQGKILIEADKWFASSKLCSKCGFKNTKLTLSDREWICPTCNTKHSRDTNAGQNLRDYGLKYLGLM